MKWILCGKNDAAVQCLEFLVDARDEVHVVGIAGDDGKDGWQLSLRKAAERLGVAFEQPRRINADDVVESLARSGADALISIQYDQILRAKLFRAVPFPCLNFHFALLPRHRGVSPMAWAILEGDDEAGVTLHHMIPDIDAGDLLAQKAVPIEPDDSARDLYDKVSVATVELFRECHPFREELLGRRLVQDGARACYHRSGDFDFSLRDIDWRRPAAELHPWLRALIFPPFQYPETRLGSRTLCVTAVAGEVGDRTSHPPGTVVSTGPDQLRVATGRGSVGILGLCDASDAGDAERRVGGIDARIREGDRFQ